MAEAAWAGLGPDIISRFESQPLSMARPSDRADLGVLYNLETNLINTISTLMHKNIQQFGRYVGS